MSKSGKPSVLTRRWVRWAAVVATVFLVGVVVGAGGKATTCEAAGQSVTAPASPGVGGV